MLTGVIGDKFNVLLEEGGKTNDDIKDNPLNLYHVPVTNSVKSLDKLA